MNQLPHGAPPPPLPPEQPAPVAITSAMPIPSRAEPTPSAPPHSDFAAPAPAEVKRKSRKARTVKAAPEPKKRRKRKAAPAKPELTDKEISALNEKRAKAIKEKRVAKRAATPKPVAVNPNRPKEAKNTLQAVLAATGVLRKPELEVFTQAVQGLQQISRSGRKRVIAQLATVYP